MKEKKIEIKEARLYPERGSYYIDVTYIVDGEHDVREVRLPKLHIPLLSATGDLIINRQYDNCNPIKRYRDKPIMYLNHIYPELGECGLRICPMGNEDDPCYLERIIEEKTQEMTIEEIEKKLGYKIKVVAKK